MPLSIHAEIARYRQPRFVLHAHAPAHPTDGRRRRSPTRQRGTARNRRLADFLGRDHGKVPVPFFIQASPPGHGPGPHTHPYAEVFVVPESAGSFLAGTETIKATGGSVVVVPPGEVHGFTAAPVNAMTCLHPNDHMVTEWLPDGGGA